MKLGLVGLFGLISAVAAPAWADVATCQAAYAGEMGRPSTDGYAGANERFQACVAAEREVQRKSACAETQAARIAEAQAGAREWIAWLTKINPHRKTISSSCGFVTKPSPDGATRVTIERGAAVVRPVLIDVLVCQGGIPKGLTEEDASRVLDFAAESVKPVAEPDRCADVDPVKRDVKRNDVEGIRTLLAWKPAASPR